MSLQRIFGKPLPPDEQVKRWRQKIRQEERNLERQIRQIDMEELKVKRTLKEAAKKGDHKSCRMLAKEIVRARKSKDRMYTSKAQLNSVGMQLQQQLAQLKVMGGLKKSTEIMRLVNRLVRLPQIHMTMEEMAKEMMKAGIIEEMMEDAMAANEDDLEEEAEEEVSKVLMEVTAGVMLAGGRVGTGLPTTATTAAQEETGATAADIDLPDAAPAATEEEDDMQARLEALKN